MYCQSHFLEKGCILNLYPGRLLIALSQANITVVLHWLQWAYCPSYTNYNYLRCTYLYLLCLKNVMYGFSTGDVQQRHLMQCRPAHTCQEFVCVQWPICDLFCHILVSSLSYAQLLALSLPYPNCFPHMCIIQYALISSSVCTCHVHVLCILRHMCMCLGYIHYYNTH